MRHFSPDQFNPAQRLEAHGAGVASAALQPGPRVARARAVPWLITCGAVLIVAVVAITAMWIVSLRSREVADAERELRNIAFILAEQSDRAFQALELIERSTVERMAALGIKSRADFRERMAGHDIHLMLRDKIIGLPHVEALGLFDAAGDLVNFSRQWPLPVVNIAGKDYYKALSANSQLKWMLGEPVRNRTTDTWTIYLVHKFTAPGGELIGFVACGIELAHFEKTFASIALGGGSAISLFRNDGTLLARHPHLEGTIGVTTPQRATYFSDERLLNKPEIARIVSSVDGQERVAAHHRLPHFPVVVAVSTPMASALAGSLRETRFIATASVLFILLAAAALFAIVRNLLEGEKQTQRLLDSENMKLNTALDYMSQGLCMFDATGRLVLSNGRYIEMYGLSADVITPGIALRDMLAHRRDRGVFDGDIDRYCADLMAVATSRTTDMRSIELRNGRTIRLVTRPTDNGWVSTHEDITSQRQAEVERDRNREFLDLIIENVPATIWVKDACDGRYMLVNRAAEELWGLPRTDIVGKTAEQFFSATEAERIARRDAELLRSACTHILDEHTLVTPRNGTKTVTSRRIAFRQSGAGHYLLGVVEDVSGRKLMERQLQQAQKMEAVGNLTGGLAHDFNNLLLIIIGNLDLLEQDIAGNRIAAERVQTVLDASLRGAELTRQMLAFSRRQPLQPKQVNIDALIDNTMRLLKRTLGEAITCRVRQGSNPWPIHVDEAQLQSALVNIAINARDAMPDGGTLSIVTSNQRVDADLAGPDEEFAPGDYVLIEITDTGTGMPADVLGRIFEPFFTTKAPGKGSGLGLSMVYGFVKQSKGHISPYSEVGLGTTFRIYLPRYGTAAGVAATPIAIDAPIVRAKRGEAILVVDDNDDVRATVRTQLASLGYEVHEAESGQAALDRLQTQRVDLVFTDMVMPGGLSGKDLADRARAMLPGLKILFTSGFPGRSFGAGSSIDAGDRLLSKPYRKLDLAQAVRELLDQPAWA